MTEEKKNEQTAADTTEAATDTTQLSETAEQMADIETERVPRNWKRTALWSGLLVLALIAVGIICSLIYTGLNQVSTSAAHKGAALGTTAPIAVQASSSETTVVVPAVRGVDATGCQEDDLVVEGNRLVFKNGCAKPVFYGK